MKTIIHFVPLLVLTLMALTVFVTPALAQEVSIPDAGLNAGIHEALQKAGVPLTGQDLLSLTSLIASGWSVISVEGLKAARNLPVLDLPSNHLARLSIPAGPAKLNVLNLSFTPLTNCSFPTGLTDLTQLATEECKLTSLTLPADSTALRVAADVASLQSQGVFVFTFPLTTRLIRPQTLTGALQRSTDRLGFTSFLARLVSPSESWAF